DDHVRAPNIVRDVARFQARTLRPRRPPRRARRRRVARRPGRGALVQEARAERRIDLLAAGESLFERVVVLALRLAVLPAEPDETAVDLAVEVEEADARILEHGAEVFDLLPAGA